MLLESLLAWIDPHGSHGWAPPSSLMKNVEPICAALNLCRFLLLREGAHNSNWTEVNMIFISLACMHGTCAMHQSDQYCQQRIMYVVTIGVRVLLMLPQANQSSLAITGFVPNQVFMPIRSR